MKQWPLRNILQTHEKDSNKRIHAVLFLVLAFHGPEALKFTVLRPLHDGCGVFFLRDRKP